MAWPFYRFVMCIVESEFNEAPDYAALKDALEYVILIKFSNYSMTDILI